MHIQKRDWSENHTENTAWYAQTSVIIEAIIFQYDQGI